MKTAQRTYGEWKIPTHVCGSDIPILCGDRLVALVASDEGRQGDDAEQLANARLLAAAPELLAAIATLVGIAEADCMDDKSNVWRSAMLDALAAIAKAEGRA
jgi:hypothetical protein